MIQFMSIIGSYYVQTRYPWISYGHIFVTFGKINKNQNYFSTSFINPTFDNLASSNSNKYIIFINSVQKYIAYSKYLLNP